MPSTGNWQNMTRCLYGRSLVDTSIFELTPAALNIGAMDEPCLLPIVHSAVAKYFPMPSARPLPTVEETDMTAISRNTARLFEVTDGNDRFEFVVDNDDGKERLFVGGIELNRQQCQKLRSWLGHASRLVGSAHSWH